jgi:predicted esterase
MGSGDDRADDDEITREGGRLRGDGTSADEGRLLARPATPHGPAPTGLQPLGLGGRRDGRLYVPAGSRPDRPAPLAVLLHGAGGDAENGLSLLRRPADDAGLILLAPASRGPTWDVLLSGFGPDVAALDLALASAFARYAIDRDRLAVGGFSDGATYALSLGLTNGDLFTHVIAFSPGFMAPGKRRGRPRLFIAHGADDQVLPIGPCSRRIVPRVRRAGYDVTYREFDDPHTVPAEIGREAVAWFAAK